MNDDATNPSNSTPTPTSASDGSAASLVAIEGLINNSHQKLATLTEELKRYREMTNDILTNDEQYVEAEAAAKTASKAKSLAKQQALQAPEAQSIAGKYDELKQHISEIRRTLSESLDQYARMSGSRHIELAGGELREIVYTARLRKPIDANLKSR